MRSRGGDGRAVVEGSGRGKGDGTGGGDGGGKEAKSGGGVEITVFAAASTKNALDLLTEMYKRSYDVKFNTNYLQLDCRHSSKRSGCNRSRYCS